MNSNKKTKRFKYQTPTGLSNDIVFGVDAENVDMASGVTLEEEVASLKQNISGTAADIPTKNSQLENDSNFITDTTNSLLNYYLKQDTYTKDEVNEIIHNLSTLKLTVVEELPIDNIDVNCIYLIQNTGEQDNLYDEFIYVNNNWELIGTTATDLSNYYNKTEIDNKGFVINNAKETPWGLAIGKNSYIGTDGDTVIGSQAHTEGQSGNTAIGNTAVAKGHIAIAIGATAKTDGVGAIAIGYNARSNYERSIALGSDAQPTASHQLMINAINEIKVKNWGTNVTKTVAFQEDLADSLTDVTIEKSGLMSAADKVKLDGITTGATKNVASTTIPKVAGVAASGTEANFARGDHVHPAQLNIDGNAGTANKLLVAKTISLTGAVTGSVSFDGSQNVSIATTMKNADATTVGGLKARLDGTTLYLTNNNIAA